MSTITRKFTDFFSDLWLDFELMFLSKKNKKSIIIDENEKNESSKNADNGILANDKKNELPKLNGEIKMMDIRSKNEARKKERIQHAHFSFNLKHLRLSKKARLAFYDEMSTLIGSGVALIDSLSLIQAQEKNKNIKKLYATMIHEVNGGLSLAESMSLFPHIFPQMQTALIEAAEASGNLKEVLSELVEEMETDQDFLKKVTGAMVYPIILLCLAVILVTGMMVFVIPKIAKMYEQSNVELPKLTQIVINISYFVSHYFFIILMLIFIISISLFFFFVKTNFGRLFLEKLISITPILGRISKEKNLMIISSNMAMLMKSGVLITEAFSITIKTVGNLHYKKALEEIRQGVVMGKEVSQMMGLIDIKKQEFKEHKLFPLQMAQLIHIGEKTGSISKMFMKIKKNYHKSIDYMLRNISTIVEPVMIFFVAAIVGSILMAVMLPFFYIGSTIN